MQPIGSSRSKKELVIENLRNAILNRELIPGTRLVIEDLAKQLGVSPIPVREALQQLDADGYVVIEPYLGAKVAPIESESVIEVFSLLETMEVVSGRAACQHMSDSEFDVLEAILLKMDSLLSEPELWSMENRHFHSFVCDKSGDPEILFVSGNSEGSYQWKEGPGYPGDFYHTRSTECNAWRISFEH